MSAAERYDEILPERATVAREYGDDVTIGPAHKGDTIEVPCPGPPPDVPVPCDDGRCYSGVEYMGLYESWPCPTCDGSGTLRVLLAEDPRPYFAHLAQVPTGWRHVGTVVPDA